MCASVLCPLVLYKALLVVFLPDAQINCFICSYGTIGTASFTTEMYALGFQKDTETL